jgi:L-ascorbate metabolism protein UlaG (beta-lactamase superfamily)
VPERLTWVGHATVLVELGGARLLTDPLLRSRLAHLRRQSAAPGAGVTQRLDAVLISHLHADHLDLPSLRTLDPATVLIGPRGTASAVRRLGFATVVELDDGERAQVGGVTVTATPAHHDGRRWPAGRAAGCVGFVVTGPRTVYFAGDTDLFDGMRDLAGDLDVALLPVWGWGPSLGPGHMDPASAAQAVALLQPRVAVPIHWGTLFPMGLRRWRGQALVEPPRVFAHQVGELAPAVHVELLEPGASLDLAAGGPR